MVQGAFPANTSFASSSDRKKAITSGERRYLKSLEAVLGRLPVPILEVGIRLLRSRQARHDLPPWFFRLHPFLEDERE
jgi:hypothetical protein